MAASEFHVEGTRDVRESPHIETTLGTCLGTWKRLGKLALIFPVAWLFDANGKSEPKSFSPHGGLILLSHFGP